MKEEKGFSVKTIAFVYAAVIVAVLFYFVILQNFGYQGLKFTLEGKDRVLAPLDALILVSALASIALLAVSVSAFSRKRDMRLFVLSLAFFFFALRQLLFLMDNFFPGENIYIFHAVHTFDVLILLSFIFLMYRAR